MCSRDALPQLMKGASKDGKGSSLKITQTNQCEVLQIRSTVAGEE
jgi:hypothetical protein